MKGGAQFHEERSLYVARLSDRPAEADFIKETNNSCRLASTNVGFCIVADVASFGTRWWNSKDAFSFKR